MALVVLIEKLVAGAIAFACVLLLVRLALGERRRARLDLRMAAAWWRTRRWVQRLWRWPSARREAARVAEEAIRRARGGVERDGNVYKPKAFRGPRKPH